MKWFTFFAVLIFIVSCSTVQPGDQAAIRQMVESREYVFSAHSALPSRSSSIPVAGSGYDLKVLGDSLSVYLPFFGRATDATAGRTGGPIELRTKDFSYSSNRTSKRWEVQIIPRGNTNIRQMNLSISENGNASLLVISNNRENISFSGTISSKK